METRRTLLFPPRCALTSDYYRSDSRRKFPSLPPFLFLFFFFFLSIRISAIDSFINGRPSICTSFETKCIASMRQLYHSSGRVIIPSYVVNILSGIFDAVIQLDRRGRLNARRIRKVYEQFVKWINQVGQTRHEGLIIYHFFHVYEKYIYIYIYIYIYAGILIGVQLKTRYFLATLYRRFSYSKRKKKKILERQYKCKFKPSYKMCYD